MTVTYPTDLEPLQKWFASIITRPIDIQNRMKELSPDGVPMEKEASFWIVPSPTLKPHERIELYNQQYWWRLLTILQDDYPFLVRLFGYTDFNQSIGIPYLMAFPPKHWSIALTSVELFPWLSRTYQRKDRRLVLGAASIDSAFVNSFFSSDLPKIEGSVSSKISLQPHVHLFSFHLQLFELRDLFLKEEPKFWEDNPFPTLSNPTPTHYILWRNPSKRVVYLEIDAAEYTVLERLKTPSTIDELCEWLENQPILKEAEEKLSFWFQKWTASGWLAQN